MRVAISEQRRDRAPLIAPLRFGAWPEAGSWTFRVWAPGRETVEIVLSRGERRPLIRGADGTFMGRSPDLAAGDRYWYRLDGHGPFPDPASRWQPCSVHGPSQLVDPCTYPWRDDAWRAPGIGEAIIYELHVGTFTPEGTFAAAMHKLPLLAELGVNVIELMPVAAFAGTRNWGYDGVGLYAPAACYGTPDELRALVAAAHDHGIAVLLDVVYNHLGPDGAYHDRFGPFLVEGGPWGAALNFAGETGKMIRAFCLDNARHWIHEYHLDGLRLDATHAYHDGGERPFVRELSEELRRGTSRPLLLIAEDERNEVTLLRPLSDGGCGLDAVWADDFHHHLRRLVAGDHEGYYASYAGTTAALADTLEHGWFFRGQHSPHHGGPRGTETVGTSLPQFVYCLQNHDQIGNRAYGDRLHHQIDLAVWRAASALLLCLPQTPLLFMGQEWAATSPFQYFTDHTGALGAAVTEGRRQEFTHYASFREAQRLPDPQAPETFARSRLDWNEREREPHASILRLYECLCTLRRTLLRPSAIPDVLEVQAIDADTLLIERLATDQRVCLCVVRLRGAGRVEFLPTIGRRGGGERTWAVACSTEDPAYTVDPQPITWEAGADRHWVQFARPGALVLLG
jgi:maltooligosyltrehalose trehalohydrolase